MKITLTLTGSSMQQLEPQFADLPAIAGAVEEWAILWLRARGWFVIESEIWETPTEFIARTGTSNMTFNRRTRDPQYRHLFRARFGPTGRRIVALCSTTDFDAVCGLKPEA